MPAPGERDTDGNIRRWQTADKRDVVFDNEVAIDG